MPRSSKKPTPPAAPPSTVTQGDGVVLKARHKNPANDTGIEHTRPILKRPAQGAEVAGIAPRVFAAFLRRKGTSAQRMSSARLAALSDELLNTPISGHRRGGSKSGTHRANPEHIRR